MSGTALTDGGQNKLDNSSGEFRHISKFFPGVKALSDVSFKALGGQVLAMCGENGAGKSTLLKVLNGDYQADEGEYLINGKKVHFKTPHEAIRAGISVIYQERQIIPYLSVAENIFMEALPLNKAHLIDRAKLNRDAQAIIDEFGVPIKPTDQVRHISIAHQQMVEIMKAYRRKPRLIAFDEPTASLSDAEITILFRIIEKLKAEGIVILYVSHRMKEIFQIADEVVVLKDGQFVSQNKTSDITESQLIQYMVGRDLGDIFKNLDRNTDIGEVVLEARHLTNDYIHDVSFQLHKGEILGFAGLIGAGRTETMRAIYGADKLKSGEVIMEGKPIHAKAPEQGIACGIGLCPEDRKDQGIIGGRAIRDNISLVALKEVCRSGGQWINRKAEAAMAEKGVADLRIKTPDIYKKIRELSGGNQQKVILARWLAAKPKVLVLDEPTKGIDVGSKSEIYQMACDLAKSGISVIFISSELPEIIGVCDRIIVMHDGEVTGELMAKDATEESVLALAMASND